MSAFHDNALIGASGQGGYFIDRSVRLRSSASAYFNRTPASAGNRKTWTWSGWVKRGSLGANQVLMSSDVGTSVNTWAEIGFTSADALQVSSYSGQRSTTAIYRDPSAWYHIVVAFDTTQSVEVDRVKFYVNGVLNAQTGDAGFPAQNTDYGINNNQAHDIGRRNWASGVGRYFDGHLTEINFVDGQALTPSDFGEYDADTGVWKPKKYVGTYGTNGFYLNFSDNTSTTTLGYDYSGNGNNWTANNISLTSGVTYDSMTDVPTLTSETAGNYAVLNPLDKSGTIINGNLTNTTTSGYSNARGTFGISSGKWYWEQTIDQVTSTNAGVCQVFGGVALASYSLTGGTGSAGMWGFQNSNGAGTFSWKFDNGTGTNTYTIFNTGDIAGLALDMDTGTLSVYRNNTLLFTCNTSLLGNTVFPIDGAYASGQTATSSVNFGQRPFAYTPPTGFKALNTFNLPDSTIVDGSQYFDATTYSGNSSTQNIVNAGGFQPDLVWWKRRDTAAGHGLADAVRGSTKSLSSSSTGGEITTTDGFVGFNSDGFALNGPGSSNYDTNYTGGSYVGWQWKAGGTAVSNTDGSITSSVSANTTSGFSIVTFTAPASGNFTVGHGLGVTPSLVIVKDRSATGYSWYTWQSTFTSATRSYVYLNGTAAVDNTTYNMWGASGHNSTTLGFTVGTSTVANDNNVAYCFAEVPGFSRMGSFVGNGSADGVFVYLGFRPKWVMIKNASAAEPWNLVDTSRDPYNVMANYLQPNSSGAEGSITFLDGLSNGFKLRSSAAAFNGSGNTMIYAAFAENPFKNSLAR